VALPLGVLSGMLTSASSVRPLRRFHLIGLFLLASPAAWSASGTLTGLAVNTGTGLPVAGATVSVAGMETSATTDLNGTFRISDVPAGNVDITASKPGLQPVTVTQIAITADEVARIEVPMAPAMDMVIKLEAFSVSADVLASSDLGLMGVRQKSPSVSDAIGNEQFSRLSLGNAAEALSKVTGVSLVDSKYVVIRGLGDRYTNTQMNGATVPSADPDKRAVQLDQFPSDLIESITTQKSFTADQPGAFSGGSVNMKTKSFPDRFFFTASASTAYASRTTGDDILVVPGGGKDWQGRDDGTRALSAAVPNPMPSSLTTTTAELAARQGNFAPARQLDAISKGFHNATFFPQAGEARPDFGFALSVGDSIGFRNDQVFGYIASLTYDRSTEHYTGGITGRYSQGSVDPRNARFVDVSRVFTTNVEEYNFKDLYKANPVVPGGAPAFGVTRSSENVDWGAYLQLAWRPTMNQEVTATFFHNQSAQDQVKRGVGEAVRSDSGGEFRENYDLLYTERGVTSLQFAGKFNFPDWNDAKLEWRAAFSRSTQDQPDYRSLEFKWSFILGEFDPSGLNNYRYFRDLQEEAGDFGLDFTRRFFLAGDREVTLKIGGAYYDGDRTNRERAFVIQSSSARTRAGIENFPNPVGIVAQTANSVTFGSVMREITSNLNYDGAQTFSAGYVSGDWRFSERWRSVLGVRFERTEILTTALPAVGLTVRPGEIRQTEALPALALIWSPSQKQNLRLSYGRTLARPTFRELADVVNYEAFTDEFIGGNPDLEMTIIDNVDLRWEWFPRSSEVIAASIFYKKLDQPIEQVFSAGRIFPSNVEQGIVYGLEFEARRGLKALSETLKNVTVGFNASLIESEVTIAPAELALIRAVFPGADDKRALYGQSPFIVNFDATWRVPAWGSTFTAVYGITGERLDLVTTGALPDVFEQPAPGLDFIWTQRISDRWKFKFSAKNLFDPEREKTLEHNGTTYFYERFSRGRRFGLSVSYAFD
jgi:TonB-dependent receptor